MTREFAEAVAFMIWADIYVASIPSVVSGIRDGRDLTFSDRMVLLGIDDAQGSRARDAVFLDWLADRREDADKLAGGLGDLLGGASGVTQTCEGWSVWATREDGAIFEASVFGYRLYRTQDDYTRGEPLISVAPRQPIEQAGGVA